MSRAIARRVAMQLIHSQIFGVQYSEEALVLAYELLNKEKPLMPTDDDKDYIDSVINGVKKNIETIDGMIQKHLHSWTIERIAKVDLAILRLSTYEMMFCEKIPNNVSISEAVNIAQEYSDPENTRFLNGILGSISRDISINK